ncbi:MAG: hypothetical protein HS111_01410 [Kofleriaceae bacterium]|nr:hypothetical protein [Kofleriaceae bacterium]
MGERAVDGGLRIDREHAVELAASDHSSRPVVRSIVRRRELPMPAARWVSASWRDLGQALGGLVAVRDPDDRPDRARDRAGGVERDGDVAGLRVERAVGRRTSR